MRIIRPFCKTVFYAFLQILAGFAIDCKAFINGQRQPRAEKICLYAVRGGVQQVWEGEFSLLDLYEMLYIMIYKITHIYGNT